ncbi:MAG: DUF429 domain-containing protein [Hyphomicrobiaceae bacterium]
MDFLGVDFSGNAAQWRSKVNTPTVWIARLSDEDRPVVTCLLPAQDLPGSDDVFIRLATLLRAGKFIAAGIDAPFSVPTAAMPAGGWTRLVAMNDALPHCGRPFPKAPVFLKALNQLTPAQQWRRTEEYWRQQGINVRSSTWWKPRGGAPFATACLKLIASSGPRPCWPWNTDQRGMLVEAFPAAQLKQWGIEYQRYNGDQGAEARRRIVAALAKKVRFGEECGKVLGSADALDAVLAAFAAIAAWRKTEVPRERDWPADEGCIAVHT